MISSAYLVFILAATTLRCWFKLQIRAEQEKALVSWPPCPPPLKPHISSHGLKENAELGFSKNSFFHSFSVTQY